MLSVNNRDWPHFQIHVSVFQYCILKARRRQGYKAGGESADSRLIVVYACMCKPSFRNFPNGGHSKLV